MVVQGGTGISQMRCQVDLDGAHHRRWWCDARMEGGLAYPMIAGPIAI